MPQSTDELTIPRYPTSELTRLLLTKDVAKIERDLKAVQNRLNAARALSWNAHDQDTTDIVSEYNMQLRDTPGYSPLDWHLIKAMLWIETGPYAERNQWETSPMQSDNPHDPGWADMMAHRDRLNQLVPLSLQSSVATPNANARDNIAAGVGYFLYKAASWGQKVVIDKSDIKTVTVERGDSLDSIARRVGTTEQVLREMNSRIPLFPLHPGTRLSYSPAKTVTAIAGWQSLDAHSAASLYNGNPRTDYANKVQFMYARGAGGAAARKIKSHTSRPVVARVERLAGWCELIKSNNLLN